jgi:hypothetical protein
VLRCRAAQPDLSSEQLAERLTKQLGKAFTAAGVRQSLHRGHDLFADLLVQEVAASLRSLTVEEIEEELRDLSLLAYCQPALVRFDPKQSRV